MDAAQRRERITAQVRRWCEEARIDCFRQQLSADAAVLIAAGHLDEPTRQVLANRRRIGRPLPDIGGFGALRALADDYARLDRKARGMRPGAMLAALRQSAGCALVMAGAVALTRQADLAPLPLLIACVLAGAASYACAVALSGWRDLAIQIRTLQDARAQANGV